MSRDLPEKGDSLADLYLREGFPDSRNSKYKGPEAGEVLAYSGISKEASVTGAEKLGGRRRGRRGQRGDGANPNRPQALEVGWL